MDAAIVWDQGREMSDRKNYFMATYIPIYFFRPGSPWDCGNNEKVNGCLRRNLSKGAELAVFGSEDLEVIANIHNHKPGEALGWRTPEEVLRETGSITS